MPRVAVVIQSVRDEHARLRDALPADGVRLSLIDARDVAEVAAVVLTGTVVRGVPTS